MFLSCCSQIGLGYCLPYQYFMILRVLFMHTRTIRLLFYPNTVIASWCRIWTRKNHLASQFGSSRTKSWQVLVKFPANRFLCASPHYASSLHPVLHSCWSQNCVLLFKNTCTSILYEYVIYIRSTCMYSYTVHNNRDSLIQRSLCDSILRVAKYCLRM